jgi:hypothetical protein
MQFAHVEDNDPSLLRLNHSVHGLPYSVVRGLSSRHSGESRDRVSGGATTGLWETPRFWIPAFAGMTSKGADVVRLTGSPDQVRSSPAMTGRDCLAD